MIRPATRSATPIATRPATGLPGPALTAEASAYIAAQSVTDAQAQSDLDDLVRGLTTDLGFDWADWCIIPCRSGYGGMAPFGGKTGVSTPALNGTATLTADGVTSPAFSRFSNNQPGLPLDLTRNGGEEPFTFYHLGDQQAVDPMPSNGAIHLIDDPDLVWQVAAYTNSSPAPIRLYQTAPTNYLAFSANSDQFEGSADVAQGVGVHSNYNRTKLFAFRQTAGEFWNMVNAFPSSGSGVGTLSTISDDSVVAPPCAGSGSGRIQGFLIWFGDAHGDEARQKYLWSLFASTVWRTGTRGRYLHWLLAGQSNASWGAQLDPEISEAGVAAGFQSRLGGTAIEDASGYGWLTPSTQARTNNYDLALKRWLESQPRNNRGLYQHLFIWAQGESDTQSEALSGAYRQRLGALFDHVDADADGDVLFAGWLPSYHRTWRDHTKGAGGFGADFTVSGLTGAGTPCNDTFAVTALADNTAPYVWTGGTHGATLQQAAGRWEFRLSDTTLICHSGSENPFHPYLVSEWTFENGGGLPVIPWTRTAGIEEVRQAIKDECIARGGCWYDSQPDERNAIDGVHLTEPGGKETTAAGMAAAIEAHFAA